MRTELHEQPRLASLPLTVRKPQRFVQHCPMLGCLYAASAVGLSRGEAEGRALRHLAAHALRMHQQGGHREARHN